MRIQLLNVRVTERVCNCEAQAGDVVQQVNAQLPNGKPIAILKDWRGLHVAIGAPNALGTFPYTRPVSEAEAERMIQEALQP